MAKINVVLEGRCKGEIICITKSGIEIDHLVTKNNVASYELIDENNKNKYSIWKAALGVAVLGGIGAVAGFGSKKEYLIAIEWKNYPNHSQGNKSLICLDERYYKAFIRSMF